MYEFLWVLLFHPARDNPQLLHHPGIEYHAFDTLVVDQLSKASPGSSLNHQIFSKQKTVCVRQNATWCNVEQFAHWTQRWCNLPRVTSVVAFHVLVIHNTYNQDNGPTKCSFRSAASVKIQKMGGDGWKWIMTDEMDNIGCYGWKWTTRWNENG